MLLDDTAVNFTIIESDIFWHGDSCGFDSVVTFVQPVVGLVAWRKLLTFMVRHVKFDTFLDDEWNFADMTSLISKIFKNWYWEPAKFWVKLNWNPWLEIPKEAPVREGYFLALDWKSMIYSHSVACKRTGRLVNLPYNTGIFSYLRVLSSKSPATPKTTWLQTVV